MPLSDVTPSDLMSAITGASPTANSSAFSDTASQSAAPPFPARLSAELPPENRTLT
jgi:hypothetical protein